MSETQQKAAPATLAEVMGEAVFLMASSHSHKFLFLADLEWLILPPLMLRQFRLWRDGPRPVAFATWAFLNEETEGRMLNGVRRLKPEEWNFGDRAWLMDVVAPNAEFAAKMIEEMKQVVFPGRKLMGLRPRAEGGGSEAAEL